MHDVRLDAGSRGTAAQQALRLSVPRPGAATDLGRALEAALDDVGLARSRGRGRVTVIFIITDGVHDPGRDSPYRDPAMFDRLYAEWEKRIRGATVHLLVYAIPIGGDMGGADLVQRVVSTARAEPPSDPGRMADLVGDIIARIGKDTRRVLVAADTVRARRLEARFIGEPRVARLGGPDTEVLLRSTAACVTFEVTAVRIASTSTTGSAASLPVAPAAYSGHASGRFRLAPGDSAVIRASMRSSGHPPSHWLPIASPVSDTLGAGRTSRLVLTAVTSLEPRAAIEALLLDAGTDSTRVPLEGTLHRIPISWPRFTLLAGLGVLIVFGLRYLVMPPRPGPFRPTIALNPARPQVRVENLRRGPRGQRVLHALPDGTRIWVTYRRASRLRSPRRVRMTVGADRGGIVGIAEPRPGGAGYHVTLLESHSPARELARRGYVVWADDAEPLPGTLAPGQVDQLRGYYWPGHA